MAAASAASHERPASWARFQAAKSNSPPCTKCSARSGPTAAAIGATGSHTTTTPPRSNTNDFTPTPSRLRRRLRELFRCRSAMGSTVLLFPRPETVEGELEHSAAHLVPEAAAAFVGGQPREGRDGAERGEVHADQRLFADGPAVDHDYEVEPPRVRLQDAAAAPDRPDYRSWSWCSSTAASRVVSSM